MIAKYTCLEEQNYIEEIGINILVGTYNAGFDWHLPNKPLASDPDTDYDDETDVMVAEPEVKRPPMYAVVMFNDDYTPMEFVIEILQDMFNHTHERAMEIMLNVHHKGKGIAGIYPRDIAETKAQLANREARLAGHPLMCQIEPVGGNDD